MCQIVRVERASKPYNISQATINSFKHVGKVKNDIDGSMQTIKRSFQKTNKQFVCMQGKIYKTFNIDRFSNGTFTKEEFDLWRNARAKAGDKPLTKEDCRLKFASMTALKNKNFNFEEI